MSAQPPARITGHVVRGDGRGRNLGFPTANLELSPDSIRPQDGIYAAWGFLNEEAAPYPAVIHVGPRPTIAGALPSLEVHLLDFPDRDLYGATITLKDLSFLRLVQKFQNLPALTAAIAADCEAARERLITPPR